jgi:hypothetical protein
MDIKMKIEKLEKEGFVYETDYNTGKHILKQALVKRIIVEDGPDIVEIKSIENGKIVNYN